MRLALAVCVLVLAAPAAALAREPVISYVDHTDAAHPVLRLYDEETESEIDPPPPVPVFGLPPFFQYGMSQNGRYIVYNDDPAPRHLHLLDRATNTLVPLPGIDMYNEPQNLTVSDGGLIAFDKQGNGPPLVYDSRTGQFADSGLTPADNEHRQPRLSGDGHFLGTVCDSATKCNTPTANPDAFIQDLVTKSDTAFPADSARDEEHPCLNGDGSLFGIDKAASAVPITGDQKHDIFLFDRSGTPVPLPSDVNGANVEDLYCVLDFSGRYLGFVNDFVTFKLYDRTEARFVMLPPGKEFDRYSVLSDPYTPPQPPGGGNNPPPGDAKPVVSRFRMAHRRFRVRPRATSFKFTLSEPGRVRIVIRRLGRKVGEIRRRGLRTGTNTISFSGKLGRRKLRPGEYAAVLIATDVAGNRSLPVLIEFRVLRPRPRRH